jgi:hypothetical protein
VEPEGTRSYTMPDAGLDEGAVLQDKLSKMMHIQRNNNRLEKFTTVMHLTYILLNLCSMRAMFV